MTTLLPLWLDQFQARPPPPPPPRTFVEHLPFDFKIVANAHGGASLRVQVPHGGASERVQMTNLWNKKTTIPQK